MQTFQTINLITVFMALIPWGFIPYGNIPLQKIGIGVQILGLVLMLGNIALLFFYPQIFGLSLTIK